MAHGFAAAGSFLEAVLDLRATSQKPGFENRQLKNVQLHTLEKPHLFRDGA